MRRMLAAAAAVLALSAASPAQAGCHLVDCVEDVYIRATQIRHASCNTLWTLRNSIYDDAGYCFQSRRAIRWFGNAGCQFDDAAEVPLNRWQRHNVRVIKGVEARRGCAGGY